MPETVLLTSEETHHLRHVLRMKTGSSCLLYDRSGREFVGRLEGFRANTQAEFKIVEPSKSAVIPQNRLRISVAQAIPQDRKMDLIVEKSAELGVFELVPLVSERTVVRIARDRISQVLKRWRRIAEQTIKQSRVRTAPKIEDPIAFSDLCSRFGRYGEVLLLDPSDRVKTIRESFSPSNDGSVRTVLLVIGPEGGFSPAELEKAEASGAKIVRMGSGILKTDTAFVAAVSFLELV